jgi:hypothetical protein
MPDFTKVINEAINGKKYHYLEDFSEEKQKSLLEYDYTHSISSNLYDNSLKDF